MSFADSELMILTDRHKLAFSNGRELSLKATENSRTDPALIRHGTREPLESHTGSQELAVERIRNSAWPAQPASGVSGCGALLARTNAMSPCTAEAEEKAAPRFELGVKDLQSSALPLGHAAG